MSKNMALSKKPVTGMKDILPEEMKIRNYVQNVIKKLIMHLDLLRLRHLAWNTLQT